MNLRDFRIGWRLLLKEPGYSAVVVLGLAVGFAACFLLLGYVVHSLSYDRHVPEREQVYRLMQKWNTASASGHWNDSTSLPARDGINASGAPTVVQRRGVVIGHHLLDSCAVPHPGVTDPHGASMNVN